MIDIHPPHHGAMTRRDILTHLAIVVAGILIAIGLEQAVEYVHHREQLAEARRALATEYKINLTVYRTQPHSTNRPSRENRCPRVSRSAVGEAL